MGIVAICMSEGMQDLGVLELKTAKSYLYMSVKASMYTGNFPSTELPRTPD